MLRWWRKECKTWLSSTYSLPMYTHRRQTNQVISSWLVLAMTLESGGQWKCYYKAKYKFPHLVQIQTCRLRNLGVRGRKFSVVELWMVSVFFILFTFFNFLIFCNKCVTSSVPNIILIYSYLWSISLKLRGKKKERNSNIVNAPGSGNILLRKYYVLYIRPKPARHPGMGGGVTLTESICD